MIDESLPLVMSPKEEENLLSNKIIERKGVLSDEQAEEVKALLTPDKELPPLPSDDFSQIEKSSSSTLTSSIVDSAINKLDSLVYSGVNEESVSKDIAASNSTSNQSMCDTNTQEEPKTVYERPVQHEETYFDKDANVHYYSDGHYWFEIPGLDSTENANLSPSERLPPGCYKKPGKLRFSTSPMKQYSTYAIEDYDRRNDDVDPVAASAEYELEKRVEKMDTFPVELNKGTDGLGLSIIGMGVGADTGLEKLGIFIKTITPGGAAEKDGRIHVNDQIIEVDGNSLVGVTQAYAASVLRNTSGQVNFIVGRDKDPENSEVAMLIRQSLQADKQRAARQREYLSQLEEVVEYESSEPTSLATTSTMEGEHTLSPGAGEEVGEVEDVSVTETDLSPDNAPTPTPNIAQSSQDQEAGVAEGDDEDVQLLRLQLREAQYRNLLVQQEVAELRNRVGELPASERAALMSRVDSAERAAMAERLETSYRQIRDYQETLHQSQEQTEGAQAILDSSQDKYFSLCKKYDQAKRLIADLRQAETVLTEQLLTREEQYALHLVRLRERVVELEEELIGTQRSAGLPVRLPYDPELGRKLLSPPELLKRQPFLPVVKMSGELSDHEEEEAEEVSSSLDRAVPRTALLDCQGAKHRAELVHRSQGLATRHRPSGEGLRAGVLRRDESSSSITSQASSNIPPKNSLGLTVNINRVTVSPARETEWKISNGSSQLATTQGNSPQSKPTTVEPQSNSPSQTNSQPSTRPHPPTPHPKPPQAGKAPMSFLAEIQAAQKRRGLEESPEPSPPQPKQSPQRPQTANQGTSHNGGGAGSLQEP